MAGGPFGAFLLLAGIQGAMSADPYYVEVALAGHGIAATDSTFTIKVSSVANSPVDSTASIDSGTVGWVRFTRAQRTHERVCRLFVPTPELSARAVPEARPAFRGVVVRTAFTQCGRTTSS